MQKELKEAVNDTRGVPAEYLTTVVRDSVGPIMATSSAMPSKASIRFVSVRFEIYFNFYDHSRWGRNICTQSMVQTEGRSNNGLKS